MKYLHRIVFHSLLLISFIWAYFALKMDLRFEFIELIKFIYILGLTVIYWPIIYIEACDYILSVRGKNGKLYKGYAKSIQKDVVVSTISAIALASIYWVDSVPYNFVGIDIGFVGCPFVISAIYTIFQMMQVKIAEKPVNKLPLIIMLLAVSLFAVLSYSLLNRNSSGEFEPYQAIWFQFTILFGSFFIFTSTSMQLYFLKNGRAELSEFKKYFFQEVIRSNWQIYVGMDKTLQKINKRTQQNKASHVAKLKHRKKKK